MSLAIIKPVITEKSINLAGRGVYCFEVTNSLNKLQIAKAVKGQFSVDVIKVRTSTLKGKRKRFRGEWGVRANKKRAYVSLKDGQKIALFEESA